MEIEDQVVSLDVAKELNERLHKAGTVPVEQYFHWHSSRGTKYNKLSEWALIESLHVRIRDKYVPTYTLTEMLDMLPVGLNGYKYCFRFHLNEPIAKDKRWYHISYRETKGGKTEPILIYFEDENPADACAKLMIWLIDNNYIKGFPCKITSAK